MFLRGFILALLLAGGALAETIRVGAAISLRDALTDIGQAYEQETGDTVRFTFGSSGQLLSQIRSGAEIDLFISAASKQVDELEQAQLAVPGTRTTVAGNALVLIVPAGADSAVRGFADLAHPSVRRLATGEPNTVPAGQYAAQVLDKLGLSASLRGRIVYGTNARQVLSYVERGEVSAGIVYATDARQAADKVRIIATAPQDAHEPIVYPAVLVGRSPRQAAGRRFLGHLSTEPARAGFRRRGFTTPLSTSTRPTE